MHRLPVTVYHNFFVKRVFDFKAFVFGFEDLDLISQVVLKLFAMDLQVGVQSGLQVRRQLHAQIEKEIIIPSVTNRQMRSFFMGLDFLFLFSDFWGLGIHLRLFLFLLRTIFHLLP